MLLLDMTMPGASSHEVVAEAAQAGDIRVILTSAYSQEMLTGAVPPSQIHGFLRKPYQLRDVVQILRRAACA